jgi:hypothetical protein
MTGSLCLIIWYIDTTTDLFNLVNVKARYGIMHLSMYMLHSRRMLGLQYDNTEQLRTVCSVSQYTCVIRLPCSKWQNYKTLCSRGVTRSHVLLLVWKHAQ